MVEVVNYRHVTKSLRGTTVGSVKKGVQIYSTSRKQPARAIPTMERGSDRMVSSHGVLDVNDL